MSFSALSKSSKVVPVRLTALTAVIVAFAWHTVVASASCVAHGKPGCFSTITAAVAAATPGETIKVGTGVYKEDVVIGKSLSLIGEDAESTVIEAAGLANGVYVDGIDHPGLSYVVVAGLTVRDAKYEGILVTNSSYVTIRGNNVLYNDKNLLTATFQCPGQPTFETGEDFDCGEGIHLTGVSYSKVANNVVANNSGGILLSDDTGRTHDNWVSGNLVKDNPFDCGITMASHAPGPGSHAPHNGIQDNTVVDNRSIHNGTQVPGAGAGVGIFADGSGPGLVTGNVVLRNELKNNGIPGFAMHSHVGPNFHAPADNLNNNLIIGNFFSGNGADTDDAATPGPTAININSGGGGTPINGTVILGNVIEDEADDIVINTPGHVVVHLNSLLGEKVGLDNMGSGIVNATENWWGCSGGPGTDECSSVSGAGVVSTPFLTKKP